MSETTAYLIPMKHFQVGQFRSIIETAFEKLKFIDGYYDEENYWYAAGENAHLLFTNDSSNEDQPFEFVEIHDTKNSRLLPEGLQEPVECNLCHTDVSENLNDLLFSITETEYDDNKETDLAAAELLCPGCGQKSKLSALSYHEKVVFTNQYLCFMAILGEVNVEKLCELEKRIDFPFEIIYGSI